MQEANDIYQVIISVKATEMLVQHIHFVAEVSPEAAERLRKNIISASRTLKQHPKRNPLMTEPELPANKYRKMIVDRRYLLIYQIDKSTVFIDYIVDARQNYRWLL